MVNHVYRSLPQTPLIGTASSVPAHHLGHHHYHHQQEFLLGDHRRRSYGGEKGQLHAELACDQKTVSSRPTRATIDDDLGDRDQGGRRQEDDVIDVDHSKDNGYSASGSRFKFRPLVSSKSSENFHQLRRVAMATVNPISMGFFSRSISPSLSLFALSIFSFDFSFFTLIDLFYPLDDSISFFCQAARRNPSLPVKLLGYRPLVDHTHNNTGNPQSNSESLPDLKCAAQNSPNRQAVTQPMRPPSSELAFGHSFSDPALVRRSSGRNLKTNDNTGGLKAAMMPTSPLIERLRADGLNSSASDCSDQSGWVSSTVSSRQSSPQPVRHRCEDEPIYPELEPVPLAPPEEFQVCWYQLSFVSSIFTVVRGLLFWRVSKYLMSVFFVRSGSASSEKLCFKTFQLEFDAHFAEARRST